VDLPQSDERHWISDQVRPHEAAVRGYLQYKYPSIDADEVVQESYLKIMKSGTARTIASTKAYFFAVARNTAHTLLRRRRIYSPIPVNELPDWRIIDGQADTTRQANDQMRLDLAVEAIDQLPPRCREILKLAALERLSPDEIAERLGLAKSTVHVQMARGIKKCADFLRERTEAR
jgi:RNA polymerase sigma-70 factor (ECF subfamily)